jgi:outer membrane murein-binding lipoprotein Lpp
LESKVHRIRLTEKHLHRQTREVSAGVAPLAQKIRTLATALSDIKARGKGLDSAVSSAASEASAAAVRASDLARRLDVLEKRFEYHLQHDGGR